MSNHNVWVATDGSGYWSGDLSDMILINTSNFTDKEWDQIWRAKPKEVEDLFRQLGTQLDPETHQPIDEE